MTMEQQKRPVWRCEGVRSRVIPPFTGKSENHGKLKFVPIYGISGYVIFPWSVSEWWFSLDATFVFRGVPLLGCPRKLVNDSKCLIHGLFHLLVKWGFSLGVKFHPMYPINHGSILTYWSSMYPINHVPWTSKWSSKQRVVFGASFTGFARWSLRPWPLLVHQRMPGSRKSRWGWHPGIWVPRTRDVSHEGLVSEISELRVLPWHPGCGGSILTIIILRFPYFWN